MKQSRAQRRASLANLKKARRARGGRRRSTSRRRARRSNPDSMPVVLVNPSPTRRRKPRRRVNPTKRRRTQRRRTRVRSYTRRLPNPTTTFVGGLALTGLGMLGGGIAAGLDWGADFAPVPPWGQALILGFGGSAVALGLGMLADQRLGAGVAGGTGALLVGRARQMVALAKAAAPDQPAEASNGASTSSDTAAVYQTPPQRRAEAGAVYREAGAVYRGDAAQLQPRTGAPSMDVSRWPGARTFKREAAASYYVPGPVRRYGPQTWAYGRDSGVVYRSAHNSR